MCRLPCGGVRKHGRDARNFSVLLLDSDGRVMSTILGNTTFAAGDAAVPTTVGSYARRLRFTDDSCVVRGVFTVGWYTVQPMFVGCSSKSVVRHCVGQGAEVGGRSRG